MWRAPLSHILTIKNSALVEKAKEAKRTNKPIELDASSKLVHFLEKYVMSDFDEPPKGLSKEEQEEFEKLIEDFGLTKRDIGMHTI